jgi:hypothetical protein
MRGLSSYTKEEIRDFLAAHGYISNPAKLVQFFLADYVFENARTAYLDVNADAVRQGDEVPERPIRITFHKISEGPCSFRWACTSVEELVEGVESKALNRQQATPKISPWPDQKAKS